MNPAERVVRRLDRYQQRHGIGIVFAVIRKFGDDRGSALAGLMTYYAFVSLFPALLLFTTALGFVMGANPDVEARLVDSALAEFPVLGEQLRSTLDRPLRGSGLGLAIGIAGSLWGALGVTQAGQHAMAELWNVPGRLRPNFWKRLGRGAMLLLAVGGGLVTTSVLTAARTAGTTRVWSTLNLLATFSLNTILFLVAFRVLTPAMVRHARLVPGAVVAAAGWSGLQALGGVLIAHQLRHATALYGFFGIVLGALSWLSLGAQLTLYSAELNVVLAQRLWPRSILQPPLTEADRRALVDLAKREERRPEERVEVTFDAPVAEAAAGPPEPGP